MRKNNFKFGNWENEEADIIIKNNLDKILSVYTLREIYHITPEKNYFKVDTESGYSVKVNSFSQFKTLLKNELIVIIDASGETIWKLPHYKHSTKLYKNMINDYSFIENKYPNSEDIGMCQICYDPLKGKKTSIIENCGHFYHTNCATAFINNKKTCPTCRTPVSSFKRTLMVPLSKFGKIK